MTNGLSFWRTSLMADQGRVHLVNLVHHHHRPGHANQENRRRRELTRNNISWKLLTLSVSPKFNIQCYWAKKKFWKSFLFFHSDYGWSRSSSDLGCIWELLTGRVKGYIQWWKLTLIQCPMSQFDNPQFWIRAYWEG